MRCTTSLLGFLAVMLLSGCGDALWASRRTNPVLEDYVSDGFNEPNVGTLSTLASYRTILVNLSNGENYGKICSEPSPDAMESVANSLAASIAVSTPSELEATSAFAEHFSRALSPLFTRSQGIQYLRDSLYHNCLARINGFITDEQYLQNMKDIFGSAKTIIEEEIKHYNTVIKLGSSPELEPKTPVPPSVEGTKEMDESSKSPASS